MGVKLRGWRRMDLLADDVLAEGIIRWPEASAQTASWTGGQAKTEDDDDDDDCDV